MFLIPPHTINFFKGKIQKLFQTCLIRNLPKQEVNFQWDSFSFEQKFSLLLTVIMFELSVFVVGLKVDHAIIQHNFSAIRV